MVECFLLYHIKYQALTKLKKYTDNSPRKLMFTFAVSQNRTNLIIIEKKVFYVFHAVKSVKSHFTREHLFLSMSLLQSRLSK